jgi:hypothetical protein
VKRVPLLALALVLAACGSTAEPTGVPASSSGESEPAEAYGPTTAVDESKLEPPPILLLSDVEKQKAVQGSYCVDYVDEATGHGQGICSDAAPPFPESVTSVARGDRVTFVVLDAMVELDSIVTVRPLGCIDQETARIRFEPGTGELQWDVDLDPGAYQLDVFARFEARDGRTGDVSGVLGLTVAGPKENDALGVHGVKRSMQVCPLAG